MFGIRAPTDFLLQLTNDYKQVLLLTTNQQKIDKIFFQSGNLYLQGFGVVQWLERQLLVPETAVRILAPALYNRGYISTNSKYRRVLSQCLI